jgi:hypothetical protein
MSFKGQGIYAEIYPLVFHKLRLVSLASFLLFTAPLHKVTLSVLLEDGFSNFGKRTTTGTSATVYRYAVLI